MKLSGARIESFVKAPDPAMRAVLVYGPDSGLVKERLDRLARTVLPDLGDPFRVADLTPAILKDDPARLSDEAAAIALTGGRRVVRVRDAGDGLTALLQSFLKHPSGDAMMLVEGGELSPRSSLRKLFEGADNAAALPCYADDEGALDGVVRETLRHHHLTVDPDALAYLVAHLGGDRRLTRAELEKLALYMGHPGRVTLADVLACVGDTAALSLDDIAMATAEGDQPTLQRVLARVFQEGTSPIAVLRAVSRHFLRLQLAAGHMAQGKSVDQAVSALKPPVIFHQAPRFRAQVVRWPADRAGLALGMLLDAEQDCKSTGLPAEEITGRTLIWIARAARQKG